MADPNLLVVYSPLGEKHEVTLQNFNDLTRHANWTAHPPHPDTVEENRRRLNSDAVEDKPAPTADDNLAEERREAEAENERLRAEAARNAAEEAEDRAAAGDEDDSEENEPALKALPSDFADMDKPAIFAYIEKTFPGTALDGRTSRDNLVAKALELAAGKNG